MSCIGEQGARTSGRNMNMLCPGGEGSSVGCYRGGGNRPYIHMPLQILCI